MTSVPVAVTAFAALAFVLGVIVLLFRAVRGPLGVRRVISPHARVEILSRASLAQRQGVATVRLGERVALVSYGEGGVRLLLTLDSHESAQLMDADARQDPHPTPSLPYGTGGDPMLESRPFETPANGGGTWSQLRKVVRAGRTMSLLWIALAASTPAPALAALPMPTAPAFMVQQTTDAGAISQLQAILGTDRKAPTMDLRFGRESSDDLRLSGPVGTVIFIGFLTLLPTLLLLMTSFTRIIVVLHLLRQAVGSQTTPPGHLLTALALLLTGFVMAPTLTEVNSSAIVPWMDGKIDEAQMLRTASGPFRDFMLNATGDAELSSFVEMAGGEPPETVDDIPLVVVMTAFVSSELKSAFQMGFALFLPFVVIDIVVASVLMSMGMFMLPPVMVSLPFKLLLFVLVDGWALIMGSLVRSFA